MSNQLTDWTEHHCLFRQQVNSSSAKKRRDKNGKMSAIPRETHGSDGTDGQILVELDSLWLCALHKVKDVCPTSGDGPVLRFAASAECRNPILGIKPYKVSLCIVLSHAQITPYFDPYFNPASTPYLAIPRPPAAHMLVRGGQK